ncbi:hypothetical protein MRX96_002220 [Rhipicephalus microplus]
MGEKIKANVYLAIHRKKQDITRMRMASKQVQKEVLSLSGIHSYDQCGRTFGGNCKYHSGHGDLAGLRLCDTCNDIKQPTISTANGYVYSRIPEALHKLNALKDKD